MFQGKVNLWSKMIYRYFQQLNIQTQRFSRHNSFVLIMTGCLSAADTLSTVILGGAGRGVTSVATQGAVGAWAGGSPLTG